MEDRVTLEFHIELDLREFDFVRSHAALHAVTLSQAMAIIVSEAIAVGMACSDDSHGSILNGQSMTIPPTAADAPLTSPDTLTLRDNGGDLGPLLRP